jgi:glycine cleavage system aminomethyltransferase T
LDVHYGREAGVVTDATPLEGLLQAHGAYIAVRHGQRVAAHFGSVTSETAVCLRSVGLADRFGGVTFDVRGAAGAVDAALQRVDGHAPAARPGTHHALVRCDRDEAARCRSLLADDDLFVTDVTEAYAALGLIGPRAGSVLVRARLAAYEPTVLSAPHGYEILVPRRFGEQAWMHLLLSGRLVGLACVGFDAIEHLAVARHRTPVAKSSPNVAMTTPATRSIQPRLRR